MCCDGGTADQLPVCASQSQRWLHRASSTAPNKKTLETLSFTCQALSEQDVTTCWPKRAQGTAPHKETPNDQNHSLSCPERVHNSLPYLSTAAVAAKGARHSTSRGLALRRGSSRPHTNSPNTAADVAKHGARSLAGSSQAANALAPAAAFACKQAGAGKARSSDETHDEFPSCPLPLRTSLTMKQGCPVCCTSFTAARCARHLPTTAARFLHWVTPIHCCCRCLVGLTNHGREECQPQPPSPMRPLQQPAKDVGEEHALRKVLPACEGEAARQALPPLGAPQRQP